MFDRLPDLHHIGLCRHLTENNLEFSMNIEDGQGGSLLAEGFTACPGATK
jgi:hypothetical protein